MDFRNLVLKQVGKITFFGLKRVRICITGRGLVVNCLVFTLKFPDLYRVNAFDIYLFAA